MQLNAHFNWNLLLLHWIKSHKKAKVELAEIVLAPAERDTHRQQAATSAFPFASNAGNARAIYNYLLLHICLFMAFLLLFFFFFTLFGRYCCSCPCPCYCCCCCVIQRGWHGEWALWPAVDAAFTLGTSITIRSSHTHHNNKKATSKQFTSPQLFIIYIKIFQLPFVGIYFFFSDNLKSAVSQSKVQEALAITAEGCDKKQVIPRHRKR